jgi:flagellar biosynthesis GTPase FlhF
VIREEGRFNSDHRAYKVRMSAELVIEEMMSTSQFNASIAVTELLMKTLENCAKDLASRCITEVASRHGFDASEEIRVLGLENLSLIRKQMAKKSVAKGEKVLKEKKVREPKEKKSVFPMPFVAENVEKEGCHGLAYNRGLFTQCAKKRMENGNFCKGCQTEADKNATGCPDCGTVEDRLATGLYEFKDPKGRSPVSYVKVLEKLKLSVDSALEESGKLNIEIPEEHFVVLEKSKKASVARGRPKKTGAIEAENVTDLFAKLSAEGDEEVIEDGEDKPVKAKKAKLSDEEKASKKAALEEERALKKAEREAKLALEREEREAKRKAEAEIKKAEREAKLALEREEREAKRAAEKLEREQKKAAEKAAKEADKSSKTKKSVAKPDPVVAPAPVETKTAVAPAPAKVSVTRLQIAGKAYLKSSTNILYDPATKEEIGLWDPESKTIKELPEEDEEVEEEDYESDA